MQKSRPYCIVIGGGVIGLSIAWELANRGCSVTIIEAGNVGKGRDGSASWAGAGILPPAPQKNVIDPLDALKSLSHRLQSEWVDRLVHATGIDTGFRRSGGIYLATTLGELATLSAQESWWREHGIEHHRLQISELKELEPGLFLNSLAPSTETLERRDIKAAWLLPGESQIRNPRLLQALLKGCLNAGVTLVEQCEICDLDCDENGRVQMAIASDGRQFEAEQFCICAGAWSRRVIEQFGNPNGLLPVRGQMLLYDLNQRPIRQILNEGNRYLVARESGHLLCGSIEEEVGFEVATSESAISEIRTWAESILPILRSTSPIRTWAGLRPGSFDGLPYLGPIPERPNLSLAAGHFRSGIHLACATAVCMADHLCDGKSRLDLAPFRLARG